MLRIDRDALICDLAETYQVFDYRVLPVPLLATLAVGLRENSRIKMSLSGGTVPRGDILLAAAVDRLSLIAWQLQCIGGAVAPEKPKSVLNALLGQKTETVKNDVQVHESPEAFEKEWARRTGVTHG